MKRTLNFLIGEGEKLTRPVEVVRGGDAKNPPYDFATAQKRVSDKLDKINSDLSIIPREACPHDEVVAKLTLHPRYLSKSDFPAELLSSSNLRAIGSRSTKVKPEQWGVQKHPEEAITSEIFIAGKRDDFIKLKNALSNLNEQDKKAKQIVQIESIDSFSVTEKIKSIPQDKDRLLLEIVLQDTENNEWILKEFQDYAFKLGAEVLTERIKSIGGLSFVPVRTDSANIRKIAQFSFVRVARGMPQIRPFNFLREASGQNIELVEQDALSKNIRTAIFDGGIRNPHLLSKWVNHFDLTGNPHPTYQKHGLGVTSAFLFGPLKSNTTTGQPYCNVDHYGILSQNSSNTGTEYDEQILDVLDKITNVLNTKDYDLVNLSLGPDLNAEDDEVTLWTAALDDIFQRKRILATVAVGNSGDFDSTYNLNRIQPPSDGVNVLSVGATNTEGLNWSRAPYSCVGPGRSPGIMKPDGVAFGGTDTEAFFVLDDSKGSSVTLRPAMGTSYAAPYVLRTAAGVKAYLANSISTLATRALLIHKTKRNESHLQSEVGWGLFETDVEKLITSENHEATIIYQGSLPVGQYLRASLPLQSTWLQGFVTITSTLLIAPEIDPDFPATYTKNGLEVAFRPHSTDYRIDKETGAKSAYPKSKPFFSIKNMYSSAEYALREDGHKWEPCLHGSLRLRSSSLLNPVFDIYFHARESGGNPKSAIKPIDYAMIITISAPKVGDLYNKLVRAYAGILTPLKPQVDIQIRT